MLVIHQDTPMLNMMKHRLLHAKDPTNWY